MGLSSLHLDAFFAAARSLNFSSAARELCITQSALSQRIKALEEELDLTLFIRLPRGVQLTEAGTRVLRYCQTRHSMEVELLENLTGKAAADRLGGQLRIGGYSSIVRSVLMPALAPLLRGNSNISVHFQNAELRDLPELLLTGAVDFVVTDGPIHRADIESIELGQEEQIMCDSVAFPVAGETFLDHDPDDPTTAQFLGSQGGPPGAYRRSFFDEIYGLIDAVALGLGRGVVSRHLIAGDSRIRVIESYRSTFATVTLHYHRQPFYPDLQVAATNELRTRCPGLLRGVARPAP
jgi:DNA-binding transcriptional LysR family regulator